MKIVSRSIISTVCYPSTQLSNYSNCTVNPGQIRIFYKAGQTRMTWRKCDPVTQMTGPGYKVTGDDTHSC